MRTQSRSRFFSGLDRFDVAALLAMLLLVGGIALVILSGDRVGLTVKRVTPQGFASSQPIIQITFDQALREETAADRVALTPPVSGRITVNDRVVQFRPDHSLEAGQEYTVTVQAGIEAINGRRLYADQQWTFRVRAPRIVYLAPVDIVQNLYLVDPARPGEAQQLTFSQQGVVSFDVAPDGSRIVYAELQAQRAVSLFVYDLRSGESRLLLDCPDADCNNPAWRPDGTMIAFERVDLNRDGVIASGLPRIWLFDLTANLIRPLFTDNQRLGYMARWSPDGRKLASYDGNAGGIVVYDFETGQDLLIRTPQGEVGRWSPDSRRLFFPKIVEPESRRYVSHLVLVDLSGPQPVQTDLLSEADLSSDVEAAWRGSGEALFVVRRPPIGQTQTPQGAQIYSLDLKTREAVPLVNDPTYSNGQMSVSPSGQAIAFQRFALGKQGARPEIWVYDAQDGRLFQVAAEGTMPRWLP